MIKPSLHARLSKFRQDLHRNPELSGQEKQTQQRLKAFLEGCLPQHLWEVGKTGLLACFEGKEPGPHILIRADIDALPIEEAPGSLPYSSANKGISHKCGHDGHASMLCGLAHRLQAQPIAKGKAYLLFQPAEETGQGAKAVLSDPLFQKIRLDYAFALHNLPGYPTNSIIMREGNFTASVKSLSCTLEGAPAHAAEPESGISPALAVAAIVQQFDAWVQSDYSREDFQLLTPIQILMGEEAYGTAASQAAVRYTLRSWNNPTLLELQHNIETFLGQLKDKYGLHISWEWLEEFHSNKNHKDAVKSISEAAASLSLQTIWREQPFKWGEDFGLFTQTIPGAMFGIGIGEGAAALHTQEYDFNDGIIPAGVAIFEKIVRQHCG